MLKNFLKIAYRNLFKYKYYSIINILSFGIGLAIFATACLYAFEELSYDQFHKNSGQIYRIANVYEKDSTKNSYAGNPFPLASVLKKEFPKEIEHVCRIFNSQNNYQLAEYQDKSFTEKNFYYADSTLFDVFDFEFISGNTQFALKKPNTVIISESIKKKYFGNSNPIGKEISINEGFPMEVLAVFKDYPEQSHIHFEIITPISSFFLFIKEPDTWLWNPCWTYIKLREGADYKSIEQKLPILVNTYFDESIKEFTSLFLQKLEDIHLHSDLEMEIEQNGRSLYIYILLSISGFLLFVSWLNFVNLSIVGSVTRIREVSIRKILGSSRRTILLQFLVEAILLCLIAFLVSLFLIEALVPIFSNSTGHTIEIRRLIDDNILLYLLIISVFAGIIVGIYTGIYASSFPLFNVARYKYQLGSRKWFSGKILILIQYTISLILLIAVFINFKQLIYLKSTSLGFNKEKIIVLPVINNPIAEKYEKFKESLLENPEIESVTAANHIIGKQRSHHRYFYFQNGLPKAQFFPELIVRQDFISTLGIEILAGTDFIKGSSESVTISRDEVIINESMVKHLGFNSNEAAIRKKLYSFKGNEHIVGVIRNFNTRSLHNPISPTVIRLSANNADAAEDTRYILVKFKDEINKENIKLVAKNWKKIAPNWPFEYKLINEILNELYKDEESLNFFLWTFSILIIIIGSMGVWAISSLISIQKTKEIGIRKAIGASIPDILKLFLKDFTAMLVLANFIAWPVSWLILKLWFKNFANHIQLEWHYFVFASALILVLTLAILLKHALKVARSHTVDSLRDE